MEISASQLVFEDLLANRMLLLINIRRPYHKLVGKKRKKNNPVLTAYQIDESIDDVICVRSVRNKTL